MVNSKIIETIVDELQVQRQKQATGELRVAAGGHEWQLYFVLGRLLYATGGVHRVRRWNRALRMHCPGFAGEVNRVANEEPWEYQLLNRGVAQGRLGATQARKVIQVSVQEVLFDLFSRTTLTVTERLDKQLPGQLILPHVEQLVQESQQIWEQWQALGLGNYSADLALILKQPQQLQGQVSPEVYQALSKLLDGQRTLWDISQQMKKSVATVARSLLPFIQQRIIVLQELPDLAAPVIQQPPATQSIAKPTLPLIACIDDSPLVGQALEKMLTPAGYQVLSILDPLRAVTTLLERKPALIFLDLIMPNTNGYELCSFLRKTSVFRDTPIVILTGQDGLIDRMRAKLSGASDFLSKPPEAEKVIQVVQQYLGSTATSGLVPQFGSV